MHAAQAHGVEVLVLAVLLAAACPSTRSSPPIRLVIPRSVARRRSLLTPLAHVIPQQRLRVRADPSRCPTCPRACAFSGTALNASEPGCIAGHSELACSRSSNSNTFSYVFGPILPLPLSIAGSIFFAAHGRSPQSSSLKRCRGTAPTAGAAHACRRAHKRPRGARWEHRPTSSTAKPPSAVEIGNSAYAAPRRSNPATTSARFTPGSGLGFQDAVTAASHLPSTAEASLGGCARTAVELRRLAQHADDDQVRRQAAWPARSAPAASLPKPAPRRRKSLRRHAHRLRIPRRRHRSPQRRSAARGTSALRSTAIGSH